MYKHYINNYLIVFVTLLISLNICGQTFTHVSQESGLDFMYESVILMGGGAAFIDYNNDELLDIYLTGGEYQDALYKNNGDGTFSNISTEAGFGITNSYVTSGVNVGDIDNDGYNEILVTAWHEVGASCCPNNPDYVFGKTRDLLFKNNRDGTFTEIGLSAGITHEMWAVSAAMGDYNIDGYIDMYIGGYAHYNQGGGNYTLVGYENALYINNGDNTFTNIAPMLEVNNEGNVLAVSFTDFDFDSDVDIYIANDFGEMIPNVLYENNYPTNSFTDISIPSNMNIGIFGMGIAIGDYDEDLDLDYYVTNIGQNILMQNNSDGTFDEVGQAAGVDDTYAYASSLLATGWAAIFFDYNHDTYLDLFVSNGHIPAGGDTANAIEESNKLFDNDGDGTFTDVTNITGLMDEDVSRGAIVGDYDNDGDCDLLVVNIQDSEAPSVNTNIFIDDNVALYRNDVANGNWLQIELIGTRNNRNAYGTRIKVTTPDHRKFIREVDGGSSHASHNSSIVHYGLGDYELVNIQVTWLGGQQQYISNIATNQRICITEPLVNTDGVLLQTKLYLEACMNTDASAMISALSNNVLIPLKQPFNKQPWDYTGTESIISTQHLPDNAIDWVLVQLRNNSNIQEVIAQKAAILLDDGQLIDATTLNANGTQTGILFNNVTTSDYYLSVHARGHMAVLSAVPITLPNSTSYDFTIAQNQAMGSHSMATVNANTYALWAGDIDQNGAITVADINTYYQEKQFSTSMYYKSDINKDGNINIEDFNYMYNNMPIIGISAIRY